MTKPTENPDGVAFVAISARSWWPEHSARVSTARVTWIDERGTWVVYTRFSGGNSTVGQAARRALSDFGVYLPDLCIIPQGCHVDHVDVARKKDLHKAEKDVKHRLREAGR